METEGEELIQIAVGGPVAVRWLDKRTSLLDVRLEWQEVERFSLINRLGKFHGRSQADGAESSSTSQNSPHKVFPQRYVTAFSLPGNVPEGVHCLSL
ncbi:uncharacterized protein A4U43_C08F17940 [Asparagus officinalis]|nr:uncharacterized protein A4U43_C08F17940 [Asparagus officinalis]